MSEETSGRPRRTQVAAGTGWSVSDYVCRAGPQDRPFEERHEGVSLSLVTEGTFDYRSAGGRAVLYPGAFLLGNAGECFECGHVHSVGDRCLALHLDARHFEEVAASIAGTSRFKFLRPVLPAHPAMTASSVALQTLGAASALEAESIVFDLIEAAVGMLAQHQMAVSSHLKPLDHKRVSAVLRHMEAHAAQTAQLQDMASLACMSKYHFLRTFRKLTGTTPHQYLLAVRLRRAALALARSREPVAALALATGFDDVSTFNRYFRRMFQVTPSQYRRINFKGVA